MKRILSLFDYSGKWGQPFADNGWDVIQWDIKISEFMDICRIHGAEFALEEFEYVDGILAAPPCTHFTVSGAQYWKAKDEDGRTAEALELVKQVIRLADLFTPTDPDYDGDFFWSLENPVGRLPKLLPEIGQPWYFQPWEFGGYNEPTEKDIISLDRIRSKDGVGVTDQEVDFVLKFDAYTKRTGLWGDFNRDLIKKPIQPVKCAPQGSFTQRYGGDTEFTKEARSNTPCRGLPMWRLRITTVSINY